MSKESRQKSKAMAKQLQEEVDLTYLKPKDLRLT
jgi:hypothetical protein